MKLKSLVSGVPVSSPLLAKKPRQSRLRRLFGALLLLVFAAPVVAQEPKLGRWSLAEDWSEKRNPNQEWSFEVPVNLATLNPAPETTPPGGGKVYQLDQKDKATQILLSVFSETWLEPSDTEFSEIAQPVWHAPSADNLPGICRSTGATSRSDAPKGRVMGHGPFLVRWRAPKEMSVSLRGGIWMPREVGRAMRIAIGTASPNGRRVEVLLEDTMIPPRSAGYTSANPFKLEQLAAAAQRPNVLTGIHVKGGESIWLSFTAPPTQGVEDFVGVDFEVVQTNLSPSAQ